MYCTALHQTRLLCLMFFLSLILCHMSYVLCLMSYFWCHMSYGLCLIYQLVLLFFWLLAVLWGSICLVSRIKQIPALCKPGGNIFLNVRSLILTDWEWRFFKIFHKWWLFISLVTFAHSTFGWGVREWNYQKSPAS